ncbi:MAG: hypothetical protein WCK02_07660 [Bacteroidota bacterium]
MKKLVVVFLMMFSVSSFAQKLTVNDIPEGVKKTFEVTRADVTNPTWEKAGELFVAKFKIESGPVEMIFEQSGMLKTTKFFMDKEYLPLKIKTYIKDNAQGFKYSNYFYQVVQGEDSYIVEMVQKTKKKLMKFSIDGKFVSEEVL